MPSFSHIFILYPLFCKDILETTTLTLATSTPQQNNRRPFFFAPCAMKREVRETVLGCLQVPQVSLIRHGNPRRSHRPLPWPEGQNDHQGSMMSLPWSVKETPWLKLYLRISGDEKHTFFFVSLVKLQHLRIQFHLGWWNGSFNPFSINWVKWNSCRTYYVCLLSKSVFWAQTEPNSYLLLGERKPKVTCF